MDCNNVQRIHFKSFPIMKYLVSRKKLEANLSQNHITGFVFRQVRFTESFAASHDHEMFCLKEH